MSTRLVTTFTDLTGQIIGSLLVEGMTRKRPTPTYSTTCQTCGARATKSHRDLTTGAARCLSSSHGRVSYAHSGSSVTTDSRTPATRSRDSRSAREYFREQEAIAEEQSHRETEEREAAKAAQLAERRQTSAEKLKALHLEWVTTGRDPQLFVSPEMQSATMPTAKVASFNNEQTGIFLSENPDYREFKCDATRDAILGYFARNGVRIYDAATIRAAFHRLRDLGLVRKNPPKQPEPAPRPAPVFVNLSRPEPEPTPGPKTYLGIDPATGRDREWTAREIDLMTANQYKQCFPVAQSFADFFNASNVLRERPNFGMRQGKP